MDSQELLTIYVYEFIYLQFILESVDTMSSCQDVAYSQIYILLQ